MRQTAYSWYMGGLLIFFAFANWDKPWWGKCYWIWTMGKDPLFIAALYVAYPESRKIAASILFFSITRFIWEIIAQVFNKDINNSMVIDYLFYIALSILAYQILKNLKEQWNQKLY